MKFIENMFFTFFCGAFLFLIFMTLQILFNEAEDARFWYPISKISADCPSMSGEFYLLTNTIGWRSWPYVLDPSDGKEIQLSQNCTTKTLTRFPELAGGQLSGYDRTRLTTEQQNFVIDGF